MRNTECFHAQHSVLRIKDMRHIPYMFSRFFNPRFLFFYFLVFWFLFAPKAQAASLFFNPSSAAVTVGDTLNVQVKINTSGAAINAFETTLSYPTTLLEGVSISKAGSFATVWLSDPVFNAGQGTIHFAGGLPAPGFTGNGKVLDISFRVLSAGAITLRASAVAILANDGRGTNLFSSAPSATYTSSARITPPETPPPEVFPETPPPEVPVIPPGPQPEIPPGPQPEIPPGPTPEISSGSSVYISPDQPGVETAPAGQPAISPTIERQEIQKEMQKDIKELSQVMAPIIPEKVAEAVAKTVVEVKNTKVYKTLDTKVINNPVVEEVSTKVASPVIVAAAAANASVAINFASLFIYLQGFFTQPFLLFTRRRRKEWGQVYSSLTKLPIDLALVRLFSAQDKKLLQTRVTDKQGRYLFLADQGDYHLEITKAGFSFPSSLLKDKTADLEFTDLYHGGVINVIERGSTLTRNIPIDPEERTETPRQVIWRKRKNTIHKTIAWVGPTLALAAVVVDPKILTVGLLGLQFGFLGLFKRLAEGKNPRSWGLVTDRRTGIPISSAVARIFDTQFNKLLETQITDKRGRYAFLVGKGNFYVTVQKQGYNLYKSPPLDLTRVDAQKIIKQDIILDPLAAGENTRMTNVTASLPADPSSTLPPSGAVGIPTVKETTQADQQLDSETSEKH